MINKAGITTGQTTQIQADNFLNSFVFHVENFTIFVVSCNKLILMRILWNQ